MKELTHLSLFSGIGGLDLSAEWAGFKTIGQCEWEEYPRKVLEKHWPDVERWKDIHELSADDFIRRTGRKEVDVISGGFPCQPHSVAGKHMASSDERDLWPEMRRVISEIKPGWVVGENVRGLLSSENGEFFRGILRDFANMGYDVGWCTISAASIGAIHKRERIAIVAHSNKVRLQRWMFEEEHKKTDEQFERICLHLLRHADTQYLSESGFLRKSNGIPKRVDRTKALGNAVVPQQFYPLFKAIADIELLNEYNGTTTS